MLFAAGRQSGGFVRQPLMLKGVGSGNDPNINALQVALANLAQKTARPLINPGEPTGIVDDNTMRAIVSATDLLTEKMSTIPRLALEAALLTGADSTIGRNAVATYAVELTQAAHAAAEQYGTQPIVMPTPTAAWYTKPYGILIIVGVLLVGFRLFVARPHVGA